jgi:soluble lytic murein transglycosylase-like protein
VKRWWGDLPDWLLWKAQLFQESHLDPAAVSPVGARGIAQIMPGTWGDLSRRLNFPPAASPHDAKIAIEAGAVYDSDLRRQWRHNRPPPEAHRLALASYNAGAGHILKAQKACGGALLWSGIAPCLPDITGVHAGETLGYVARIEHWRALMAERR